MRDLAVLDTYNPRSVAFQVAALNEHIASLPSLKEHGLIERPQRLAVAVQSTLATAEAEKLEAKTLFSLEQDLLSLAEAIGAALLPARPQCEPAGKADGAGVIYDIRHVTTYEYESPVSFARCTLRLEPRSGDGQELVSHSGRDPAAAGRAHVRRDFFGTASPRAS